MTLMEYDRVVVEVAELCKRAAFMLDPYVEKAMRENLRKETTERARFVLSSLLKNAEIARQKRIPLCQDTGMAVFFVELGTEVSFSEGTLYDAIWEGTARGYTEGYLRKSIVEEPLFERKNTKDNTPPVIHLTVVPGAALRVTLLLKGAGAENMSKTAVLKPHEGREAVLDFVTRTVAEAGANPCPPVIVGIGLGGNFETAPSLAKKALLRRIGDHHPDPRYAELERKCLARINRLGVGPEGLGGETTALAVFIETAPCHIASLPIAVNLNCHAVRHASFTL